MTNEALFSLRKGSIGERTKRAVKNRKRGLRTSVGGRRFDTLSWLIQRRNRKADGVPNDNGDFACGAAGRAVVNGRRQRRKGKNSVFSVFVSSVDIFLFDHLDFIFVRCRSDVTFFSADRCKRLTCPDRICLSRKLWSLIVWLKCLIRLPAEMFGA